MQTQSYRLRRARAVIAGLAAALVTALVVSGPLSAAGPDDTLLIGVVDGAVLLGLAMLGIGLPRRGPAVIAVAALADLLDLADYPNCVQLLAQLRYTSALNLPGPVDQLDAAGARAIEVTTSLVQLCESLGWDAAVRARMADMPPLER